MMTEKKRIHSKKKILITIDLEDWFQVENLKKNIGFSRWPDMEYRFQKNTSKLLDLFNRYNIKTTFFILGWNVKLIPKLIKEIHSMGHEVASHGFNHELCNEISPSELKKDLIESKSILENIIGQKVSGYRAPSFSISDDVLNILKNVGFNYDSSHNSFSLHDRYGKIDLSKFPGNEAVHEVLDRFWEIPVSNLTIGKMVLPWGGGGYFRITPWTLFAKGIEKILSAKGVYVFYLHPWEIDPDQPKVDGLHWAFKLRHYSGLAQCFYKVNNLLEKFSYCDFVTCSQYLKNRVTNQVVL